MLKDKYEISIWKDKPVYNQGVYQGLQEHKIAIIGSDTLTSPYRAIEPELVENINGTNKLTFKMFYRCKDQSIGDLFYINQNAIDDSILTQLNPELRANRHFDEIPEEGYENPFISFMVNERKVKLKWKDKWYDFIIKNCQEDSDKTTVTYTCTDAYINELSKNGYGLTFDNELMNNQGTVTELGARIARGTDWKVIDSEGCWLQAIPDMDEYEGHEYYSGFDTVVKGPQISDAPHSDTIYQKNEEPVIPMISQGINATNDQIKDSDPILIPSGDQILAFYPPLVTLTKGEDFKFQFAYTDDEEYVRDDESLLVTNTQSYSASATCTAVDESRGTITIAVSGQSYEIALGDVSTEYRATRWHDTNKCIFDSHSQKYCYELQKNGHTYYYYRDVAPVDATAVVNILTNPSSFANMDGWIPEQPIKDPGDSKALRLALYPKESDDEVPYARATSYLRISNQCYYYNAGLSQSATFLPNGFQPGTEYMFMYQAYSGDATMPSGTATTINDIRICQYSVSNGTYTLGTNFMSQNGSGQVTYNDETWNYIKFKVTQAVTREEISAPAAHYGFFIKSSSAHSWIRNVQFFMYIPSSSTVGFVLPNSFVDYNLAKVRHNIYDPSTNQSATSIDQIKFTYQGFVEPNSMGYTFTSNNFEKIRSISGKQSNRFNLLQALAEQFNCWVCFYTGHEANGAVKRDEKYIYFKEEKGVHVGIGFVYGIDLKTIQRTIQSDQIVTRTIVNPNNNEFAPYGSCNIVRADSNYAKSNSIFDFGYYTNSGLLDAQTLQLDLYGVGAYFPTLRRQYTIYDEKIEEITHLETEKSKLQGYIELYSAAQLSAAQLQNKYLAQIALIVGVNVDPNAATMNTDVQTYIRNHDTTENIQELLIQWRSAVNEANNYQYLANECQSAISEIDSQLTQLIKEQNQALLNVRNAEDIFFQKYSQYIQEGTWQNEEYMDDNLYYLDGVNVAYASSRPQISYNVSVLRLSSLEEFQNKVFHLGDITFIQDAEFFGYIDPNNTGIRTPYKEKVIITEYKSYLDEPEKDSFTVQNYRSSFDDLFQRITAATQSLQYHEGEYARAANAFTQAGALKAKALQDAFNENKDLLLSSNNNRIIQDENGITLYSADDPSRQVRINANGLFITTDNGENWLNAIRSTGVATETLSAGSINAAEIAIVNNTHPALSMDVKGFTAYKVDKNKPHHNIFVRMDQYGLYGIDTAGPDPENPETQWYEDWIPGSVDDVVNNATFSLTWAGFKFKGDKGGATTVIDNSGIKISTSNKTLFEVDGGGNLNFSGIVNSTYFYADASGAGFRNGDGIGSIKYLEVTGNGIIFKDKDGISYLTVDANGAKFTGAINATSGKIGNWSISDKGLFFPATGTVTVSITPTQLKYGNNFSVSNTGYLTCSSATIGGWFVNSSGFYTGSSSQPTSYLYSSGIKYGSNNISSDSINLSYGRGSIGGCTVTNGNMLVDNDHIDTVEFSKIKSVQITANMITTGTLQADQSIELASDAYIYNGKKSMTSPASGFYIGGNGIYIGDSTNYIKYQNGTLTITAPVTVGSLSASNIISGTFQSNTEIIVNGRLYYGKTTFSDSRAGFYLSRNEFSIGSAYDANYFKFDGTSVEIKGKVTMVSGTIGWWSTGYIAVDTYGGNMCIFSSHTGNPSPNGGLINLSANRLHLTCYGGNSASIYIGDKFGGFFAPSYIYIGDAQTTHGQLLGSWTSSSSIGVSSDKSLKNSILSIPLQYTTLFDNLRPVIYKYNDGTSDRFHTGFIAQDVEQAILDASLSTQDFAGYIKTKDDICYLRYEEFIALNTWQIQHLKSRVAELESRLAALESTKI